MPLPEGFKVNGSKVVQRKLPPSVQKIIALLDKLPSGELLTTAELTGRLGLAASFPKGSPVLAENYYHVVDHKAFWGSCKSIAELRKQLAEIEKPHDQN